VARVAAVACCVWGSLALQAQQPLGGGRGAAFSPDSGLFYVPLSESWDAAETYMLDGRQYVIVAAGDSLYAVTVNP
jgi:hypothetical protein